MKERKNTQIFVFFFVMISISTQAKQKQKEIERKREREKRDKKTIAERFSYLILDDKTHIRLFFGKLKETNEIIISMYFSFVFFPKNERDRKFHHQITREVKLK